MKLLINGKKFKIHGRDYARAYTYVIMSRYDVLATPVPDELIYRLGGKFVNN